MNQNRHTHNFWVQPFYVPCQTLASWNLWQNIKPERNLRDQILWCPHLFFLDNKLRLRKQRNLLSRDWISNTISRTHISWFPFYSSPILCGLLSRSNGLGSHGLRFTFISSPSFCLPWFSSFRTSLSPNTHTFFWHHTFWQSRLFSPRAIKAKVRLVNSPTYTSAQCTTCLSP